MLFIVGLLVGYLLFSIIRGRPIIIHIKHEYDNKYVQVPDIEEVLDPSKENTDAKLESIYKEMGNIFNGFSDLMTGGDTNGEERK